MLFVASAVAAWVTKNQNMKGILNIALLLHMLDVWNPRVPKIVARPSSNSKVARGKPIRKLTFLINYSKFCL
jgi:hypothetical protein